MPRFNLSYRPMLYFWYFGVTHVGGSSSGAFIRDTKPQKVDWGRWEVFCPTTAMWGCLQLVVLVWCWQGFFNSPWILSSLLAARLLGACFPNVSAHRRAWVININAMTLGRWMHCWIQARYPRWRPRMSVMVVQQLSEQADLICYLEENR